MNSSQHAHSTTLIANIQLWRRDARCRHGLASASSGGLIEIHAGAHDDERPSTVGLRLLPSTATPFCRREGRHPAWDRTQPPNASELAERATTRAFLHSTRLFLHASTRLPALVQAGRISGACSASAALPLGVCHRMMANSSASALTQNGDSRSTSTCNTHELRRKAERISVYRTQQVNKVVEELEASFNTENLSCSNSDLIK